MLPIITGVVAESKNPPTTVVVPTNHYLQMATFRRDSPTSITTWTGNAFLRQGSGNTIVGLCFFGIQVPQGAVVESAVVQVRATSYGGTMNPSTAGKWYGWDTDDVTDTFPSGGSGLTSRTEGMAPRTAASYDFAAPSKGAVGQEITQDVTNIVKEIVSRTGWSYGNGMQFNFYGSTTAPADDTFGEASLWRGNDIGEPNLIIRYRTA